MIRSGTDSLRSRSLGFLLLAASITTACDPEVEQLGYEVVLTLPHDTAAYTQGLVYHDRFLWESTGRYGHSAVRKVNGRTGAVVRSSPLPDSLFGEGLALVGDDLVQLTWQSGMALYYDTDSLRAHKRVRYEGEGWGLCFDGRSLVMTNGSDSLYFRDPATFEIREVRQVTAGGRGVRGLNELECVGEFVYANVYQEDRILKIDKSSGRVLGVIDGSQLRIFSGVPTSPDAVLNGIAHDSVTGLFFLTGKLWPNVYVVRVADPG
jgi:glutaminyl-peptide cyclotransferase